MLLSSLAIRHLLLWSYSISIVLGIGIAFVHMTVSIISRKDYFERDISLLHHIISLLSIASGILGLIGVMRNWRIILKVVVGQLSLVLVLLMILVLIETVAAVYKEPIERGDWNSVRSKIVTCYGNNNITYCKRFTESIDSSQEEDKCCGFSQNNEAENLFLYSPWFRQVNANVTTGKKITLPDSCCVVVGPNCREAEDLKEAREKNYIHKEYNCMREMEELRLTGKWISIISKLFVVICQSLCIAATVLKLVNSAE